MKRWEVKFDRRGPEWHECSRPYLVNEKDEFVAVMKRNVPRPGIEDKKAIRQAYKIRNAVNAKLEEEEHKQEYVDTMEKLEFDYNKCVRLYDGNGNHVLTVCRCFDCETDFDLATPDGHVVVCAPITDYWMVALAEHFPIEDSIDDQENDDDSLHMSDAEDGR